jgi:hypothetical protein
LKFFPPKAALSQGACGTFLHAITLDFFEKAALGNRKKFPGLT